MSLRTVRTQIQQSRMLNPGEKIQASEVFQEVQVKQRGYLSPEYCSNKYLQERLQRHSDNFNEKHLAGGPKVLTRLLHPPPMTSVPQTAWHPLRHLYGFERTPMYDGYKRDTMIGLYRLHPSQPAIQGREGKPKTLPGNFNSGKDMRSS
mmetsp:Transcript_10630/g.15035  ORF Transcript_10630/g.15035 Transcript_10630/m.15035 type:complete len:149 (-) Transcript_10630:293-739(-)